MEEDDLYEEIVPRTVKKIVVVPFQKKDIGTVRGKSSKYLREVTIPTLQAKISDLKTEIKKARATRDSVKASKKAAIKKATGRVSWRLYKRKQSEYGKAYNRAFERFQQHYLNKTKKIQINRSNYIDGVTIMPIMIQWCNENNFQLLPFNLLVILNHYKWFNISDGVFFGYSKYSITSGLKTLVKLGLVEKIIAHRKLTYFPTKEGRNKFISFKSYFKKKTTELFDRLDKQFEDGELEIEISPPRRFKKINENGDTTKT